MMICKFKLNRKTAVIAIVLAAIFLAGIVLVCSEPASGDIGTTEGRVSYLSELGWEVDPETEQREVIILPREFGDVMLEYNEMQRGQGFDLSLYAGMECERYAYSVINYPNGDPKVLAQIFICGTRVIGGDIHSTAMDGFMHGIK
ncbi:MAG: DUF4830 domain-containing protein [Clostridia bacterium]|nr:DUF4830 domain-containing protein [Clostridia bacterium]